MVGLAAATPKFKAFTNAYQINIMNYGSLALDSTLGRKILKRHLFQDVKNSFHGVTQIGLKPHQFFSTNMEFKVFAYYRVSHMFRYGQTEAILRLFLK